MANGEVLAAIENLHEDLHKENRRLRDKMTLLVQECKTNMQRIEGRLDVLARAQVAALKAFQHLEKWSRLDAQGDHYRKEVRSAAEELIRLNKEEDGCREDLHTTQRIIDNALRDLSQDLDGELEGVEGAVNHGRGRPRSPDKSGPLCETA